MSIKRIDWPAFSFHLDVKEMNLNTNRQLSKMYNLDSEYEGTIFERAWKYVVDTRKWKTDKWQLDWHPKTFVFPTSTDARMMLCYPIITNKENFIIIKSNHCDPSLKKLEKDSWYLIDTTLPHSFVNASGEDTCFLKIDILDKDWVDLFQG